MEIDPRFCDQALADTMAALGVTRISLGVQDFDLVVQQAINRLQSPELTAAAIARLRQAGLRHFNIDLVHGLPRQTLETLSRTSTRRSRSHHSVCAAFDRHYTGGEGRHARAI